MTKKIIAILLSLILCFSCAVPAMALDLGGIIGGIGGGNSDSDSDDAATDGFDVKDILGKIMASDIMASIMGSDGVVDLTAIVMDVVLTVMSGQIKEDAKDLAVGVIQSNIDTAAQMIVEMYENAGLVVKYDKSVIENYFNVNFPKADDEEDKDDDDKKDPNELQIGLGDVDCDGRVTVADARLILRRAIKLIKFSPVQEDLADVDRDGKITVDDARTVLRVAVGLEKF